MKVIGISEEAFLGLYETLLEEGSAPDVDHFQFHGVTFLSILFHGCEIYAPYTP